jgi:hypothetical protein
MTGTRSRVVAKGLMSRGLFGGEAIAATVPPTPDDTKRCGGLGGDRIQVLRSLPRT